MGTCPGCGEDVKPMNKGNVGWGVTEFVCPECDTILGVASTSASG